MKQNNLNIFSGDGGTTIANNDHEINDTIDNLPRY